MMTYHYYRNQLAFVVSDFRGFRCWLGTSNLWLGRFTRIAVVCSDVACLY